MPPLIKHEFYMSLYFGIWQNKSVINFVWTSKWPILLKSGLESWLWKGSTKYNRDTGRVNILKYV